MEQLQILVLGIADILLAVAILLQEQNIKKNNKDIRDIKEKKEGK